MAITSQVSSLPAPGEMVVTRWAEAGLLKPSVTKPAFATIEKPLIVRRFGRFETVDRETLSTTLMAILRE